MVGTALSEAAAHGANAMGSNFMLLVGAVMLKGRGKAGGPDVQCIREKAPKVLCYGLGSGLFSSIFGIGRGFLVCRACRLHRHAHRLGRWILARRCHRFRP